MGVAPTCGSGWAMRGSGGCCALELVERRADVSYPRALSFHGDLDGGYLGRGWGVGLGEGSGRGKKVQGQHQKVAYLTGGW